MDIAVISDINPNPRVPQPYSNEKTAHQSERSSVNPTKVRFDPALELTPQNRYKKEKNCKHYRSSKSTLSATSPSKLSTATSSKLSTATSSKLSTTSSSKLSTSRCSKLSDFSTSNLSRSPRNSVKTSAKNSLSIPQSEWCTQSKPIHWYGYDHATGKKIQKISEYNKSRHSKIRRPTFCGNYAVKKHLESKNNNKTKHICSAEIHKKSETELTKYHKPEFNSGLKLARELSKLQLAKSNIEKEIAQQMKSELIKQEINEKASTQVNIPFDSHLYSNLISIDVAPEDIANKLQEDMEMKMKAAKPQPRPRDPEPDLMEFFTPTIYHECCNRYLEIPSPPDSPQQVSPEWAFRQYRRRIERNEL